MNEFLIGIPFKENSPPAVGGVIETAHQWSLVSMTPWNFFPKFT
jgi:hypothetical protein